MKAALRIFLADLRRATGNVIAGIVCVGMIVVPSLYAWFNIAGSWDPYANTGNISVAVANTDKGYTSDLLPVSINVGERVTSELRANDSIGWVVTDKDEALEGLKAGRYYAAVVIPEDFSSDLLGSLGKDAPKPQLLFYDNQKENAIANVVTDKASGALQEKIDTAFAQTVGDVGASALTSMGDYLDSEQVAEFAKRLDGRLQEASAALRRDADGLESYASLTGSVQKLLDGSDALLGETRDSADKADGALGKAADGVRDASGALASVDKTVDGALADGRTGLKGLGDEVDKAFSDASAGTDALADRLDAAAGTAAERKAGAEALKQGFDEQARALEGLRSNLEAAIGGSAPTDAQRNALRALDRAIGAAQRASEDLGSAAETLDDLGGVLSQTADDLRKGSADLGAAQKRAQELVQKAQGRLDSAGSGYEDTLGGPLTNLADALDKAAAEGGSVASILKSTASSLKTASEAASGDLSKVSSGLSEAAGKLDKAADELDALHGSIERALASGDMEQLRRILGGNPTALAAFLSAPVQLERTAVFPVENNGSAMAPFYTTLALWVGAIVLVVLMKVEPDDAQAPGATLWQRYMGRLGVFVVLALLQATLVCAGNLWFLQIQCEHPLLMFLACWTASFVDVNIMYALTVAMGDVGKALAVVLLVVQVAGSGGSFPPEMLPPAFQALYPFLPFVQAIACMRGAVAGVYGAEFWVHLGSLLAFLAPALLLGLVLRKPFIRLNRWVEHSLERTRVM